MNKTVGIILVVVLVLGGAWFVFSDDSHHDHEADDHKHEHDELSAKEPVRADGTFSIATSFYPLEFAINRIIGDLAEVTNVGAGRDPHDFRPSTQDILAMQRADLVVLQGAALEPWGDAVQDQLKTEGVPVLLATNELTLMEAGEHHDEHGAGEHNEEHNDHGHDETEDEDHHGHNHGAFDPHTWLDPVLFSQTVEHLTEAIVSLDPENAETYQANAATLQADLADLDVEYASTLTSCTASEVITSHDAFGYVGARYGFTIHSIAGISTQDLPSATTLATLRAEAAEGINAILLEANSVTAYGETLADETGLQTLSIDPIAFTIGADSDYFTVMRANLDTFATALACTSNE